MKLMIFLSSCVCVLQAAQIHYEYDYDNQLVGGSSQFHEISYQYSGNFSLTNRVVRILAQTPNGLGVDLVDRKLVVVWNKARGATTYAIYSSNSNTPVRSPNETNDESYSFIPEENKQYNIWIEGVNPDSKSKLSAPLSFNTADLFSGVRGWIESQTGQSVNLTALETTLNADFDRDVRSDIMEYAHASNPTQRDTSPPLLFSQEIVNDAVYVRFEVTLRSNDSDLTHFVEIQNDQGNWQKFEVSFSDGIWNVDDNRLKVLEVEKISNEAHRLMFKDSKQLDPENPRVIRCRARLSLIP